MNTTSMRAAETASTINQAGEGRRVLVWDVPVRVFHWLMVLCFAGAYLSAEVDSLRLVHVTLGYTMFGLVGFRLVWGVVGSRYARFSSFVRGPAAVGRYLRSLLGGRPERSVGHNPAGAIAIVALLASTVLLVATGWANYTEIAGHWMEELHEGVANAMLALVALHVGGVLLSSVLHRENLLRAMVTGRKQAPASAGIRKPSRALAGVLLACVLGFWAWQWQAAPAAVHGERAAAHHHDRD